MYIIKTDRNYYDLPQGVPGKPGWNHRLEVSNFNGSNIMTTLLFLSYNIMTTLDIVFAL